MTPERLRRVCAQRGIRIEKNGAAFRLTGPGVSLLVSDLRFLHDADLEPPPNSGAAFTRGKSMTDVLGRRTGGG